MKKSFLILSMASLLSASVFAKNLSFSNPRTLLPNEDVQSFELADLDGNGKQEIVYLTSNGELKYAALGDPITESSRDVLLSTKWVINNFLDKYGNSITIYFRGPLFFIESQRTKIRAPLYFKKDGKFEGQDGNRLYILIDYISDTEISGKLMDQSSGIFDTVSFTAVPKLNSD